MNPANFSNDYHTPRTGPTPSRITSAPSRVSPPVSRGKDKPFTKVFRTMWTSSDFLSLSAAGEPSAQVLFVYLLTGPKTTCIPGVVNAGPAALAEALGWSVDGVRACLDELVERGMADYDSRGLVWLCNAIHWDGPVNENMVKKWRTVWSLLPTCPLKARLWETLASYLSAKGGDAWVQTFATACPEPSPESVARSAAPLSSRVKATPSDKANGATIQNAAQPKTAPETDGGWVTSTVTPNPDTRVQKPEATHTHTASAYTHEASRVETVPFPAVVVEPAPVVVVPPAPPTSPSPVSVDAPPPAAPSAAPTVPVAEVPTADPAPSHAVAPSAPSPAPVAAVPRPRCLSPEAEAILCELERYPSLASIATPRRAEGASTLLVTCGVTLADVLAGLQDLAAKAAMVDWSADTLAQCVPSYAKTAAKNRRARPATAARPDARSDARAETPTPKPVMLLSAARTTPLRPVWSMTSGAPASGAPAPAPVDAATARAKLAACHASFDQRSRVETREEKIARQRAALFAAESLATSRAVAAVGGAP